MQRKLCRGGDGERDEVGGGSQAGPGRSTAEAPGPTAATPGCRSAACRSAACGLLNPRIQPFIFSCNADAAMSAPEQQAILEKVGDAQEESRGAGSAAAADARARALAQRLAAKEAELAALSAELEAHEEALVVEQQGTQSWVGVNGPAVGGGDGDGVAAALDTLAARWRCLAARRDALAARWQLLVEVRRELGSAAQAHRQGGCCMHLRVRRRAHLHRVGQGMRWGAREGLCVPTVLLPHLPHCDALPPHRSEQGRRGRRRRHSRSRRATGRCCRCCGWRPSGCSGWRRTVAAWRPPKGPRLSWSLQPASAAAAAAAVAGRACAVALADTNVTQQTLMQLPTSVAGPPPVRALNLCSRRRHGTAGCAGQPRQRSGGIARRLAAAAGRCGAGSAQLRCPDLLLGRPVVLVLLASAFALLFLTRHGGGGRVV